MRSRRPDVAHRPLYARLLRLRHVAPSGFLCFVFLEGAIALGALLALAELVSWWGVLVLPAVVALMVKLNDVIAGALSRPAPSRAAFPRAATGPAMRLRDAAAPRDRGALRDHGALHDHDHTAMGGPAAMGGSAAMSGLGTIGGSTVAGEFGAVEGAAHGAPLSGVPGEATTRLPGVIRRDQGAPIMRPWAEEAEAQQQRVRQSATRRYE